MFRQFKYGITRGRSDRFNWFPEIVELKRINTNISLQILNGKADKMTGAKGVIFDDVIAGFFGGLSSLMTYHLFMKFYS